VPYSAHVNDSLFSAHESILSLNFRVNITSKCVGSRSLSLVFILLVVGT